MSNLKNLMKTVVLIQANEKFQHCTANIFLSMEKWLCINSRKCLSSACDMSVPFPSVVCFY